MRLPIIHPTRAKSFAHNTIGQNREVCLALAEDLLKTRQRVPHQQHLANALKPLLNSGLRQTPPSMRGVPIVHRNLCGAFLAHAF
jgi:hypothetical protein